MPVLSQSLPGACPQAVMEPPIILVNDWSDGDGHPVALRYIRGFNDIRFQVTYGKLMKLERYPACQHQSNQHGWPCKPCEDAFTKLFWSSCALILDYFADFHHIDTPGMHVVWYKLLDVWQEGALWLPYEDIMEGAVSSTPIHVLRSAMLFSKAYNDAIELVQKVVDGEKDAGTPTERFIYRASFEQKSGAGTYEPGPWRSGLKPWEQFLSARSPGVELPSDMGEEENAHKKCGDGEVNNESLRFVPMAAIAIVEKHTEHTRTLAAELAEKEPEVGTHVLNTFEQHSLRFPAGSETHSYTSMTGHEVAYQLKNGAPPIIRDTEYHDPDMQQKKPDLQLVDESLAKCMGVPAYVPRSAPDFEVENGLAFDMLAVRESRRVEKEGETRAKPVVEGLQKMFDYWCEEANEDEW